MQGPRSLPKTKKKIPWRSHGLIENFAWRWKPEGNRLLKQAKANKNTSKGDQLKWRCLSSWLINIPCQSHSQSVGRLVGWSVGRWVRYICQHPGSHSMAKSSILARFRVTSNPKKKTPIIAGAALSGSRATVKPRNVYIFKK